MTTSCLGLPPFVDQAGHLGGVLYLDEFAGHLFQDGELIAEGDEPRPAAGIRARGAPRLPARLLDLPPQRLLPGSDRAERRPNGSSAQGLESYAGDAPPSSPLDYDLQLSETNTAPGGASFSFGLGFRMPSEVAVKPLARVSVEVSLGRRDVMDGARRSRLPKQKSCTVKLKNQRSGSASLRSAPAADTAGRSVTQTVIDAYAVH